MEPSLQESEQRAGLSRAFIVRAEEELAQGDRLQASEKGWGAVAQAIKAIGDRRGWNHNGHRLLIDIAKQVADEQARPDLYTSFMAAQGLHTNFYEDWMAPDGIAAGLENVKTLVSELERLRAEGPPPPLADPTNEQRNRWRRLTGDG